MPSQEALSTEQRLQNAKQRLAATSSRLARGARVTRIVGIILLLLMCGYFIYGYRELKTLAEPDFIVPLLGERMNEAIPGICDQVNQTVAQSAPDWAESLSTMAIEAAPSVRKSLENYVLDQTAGAIDKVTTTGETHFRKILRDNREEFREALQKLGDDEQYSEETLAVFKSALEREMGRNMQEEAQDVLGTLIGLKEKLIHLAQGTGLTKDEALERRTLMTVRYIQLREADSNFEERIKQRTAKVAEVEAEEVQLQDSETQVQSQPETSTD